MFKTTSKVYFWHFCLAFMINYRPWCHADLLVQSGMISQCRRVLHVCTLFTICKEDLTWNFVSCLFDKSKDEDCTLFTVLYLSDSAVNHSRTMRCHQHSVANIYTYLLVPFHISKTDQHFGAMQDPLFKMTVTTCNTIKPVNG